eukprot:CAMPEP_0197437472 /NCGR_PEP_ID=MMETSP1175-20131217/4711_1 /TAXON_ID=1003142 /ORGANISM="Triceratium dubium, Strain CCMP147" /LENGTH=73 /DNA_ID=CAMNT_0042967005 /DNA_START=25 /DNA_END=243 /DNA_ORIENTATION=+
MKIAILASLVAGSSAFVPVQQQIAPATVLNAGDDAPVATTDIVSALGSQAPLGYIDPLNFFNDPTNADAAEFD